MLVAQEVKEGDVDENVADANAGYAAEEDVSAAHDEVPTADEEPSIPSPIPPTLPPQPSQDIHSTTQVQPTPPQSPQVHTQSPQQQQPTQDPGISMNLLQDLMDTCTALTRRVEHLELDKITQALEITKLNQRVKKLEMRNKGRRIADMDADADVVLEEAKEVADDAKDGQDADVQVNANIQGRIAESQAEIYKIDLDHANKVLSIQEEESKPTEFTTITATDVLVPIATTAATSTLTVAPSKRTKGVVIRDPKESTTTTTTSTIIHFEGKSKDKAKFDSNVAFLQKTKEQIGEEESRALKRINETPAEKAEKRQKMDEEVEELKRYH
nr:hypothetical protein [Tanacetum cinerariifolium]